MPLELIIQAERELPVPAADLERAMHRVLAAVAVPMPPAAACRVLTVRVTDDREIRELNRIFRGLDEATDVLSFGYGDESADTDLQVPLEAAGVLGDLVLSRPYIDRWACQAGTSPAAEFMLCFVHGLLHLLGMDHDTAERAGEMFPLQDRLVRALGFRPHPTWPPAVTCG